MPSHKPELDGCVLSHNVSNTRLVFCLSGFYGNKSWVCCYAKLTELWLRGFGFRAFGFVGRNGLTNNRRIYGRRDANGGTRTSAGRSL